MTLRKNSLVLYKNQPARITEMGKKIALDVHGGQKVTVRPKDVALLHPGPLSSFGSLNPPDGDILTAWELLAGETTSLEELAELAFDEFTPATAWAIWQAVEEGVYFHGTAVQITVHTEKEVQAIEQTRAAKAAEEAAWDDFLARMKAKKLGEEDGRFLQDTVGVAKGLQNRSRVLKALGRSETPEQAHRLLLDVGYWDEFVNPYPTRLEATTTSNSAPLPELPDEERRDLTHLVSLAIDDEGSTDPDDALSWDNGRLWVHIADVAAIVTPDSLADLEARARGANLYLPEGIITMLPDEATNLLALGLSETSPALSFRLDIAEDGTIANVEIVPSWVRVTRLSYAEAINRLDESPFKELYELARLYEARRIANEAVQIDLPEIKVRVKDGVVEIRPLPPLKSRDLVREAMLMTGEAVAHFARDNQIPLPYTVQDPPNEIVEGETPADMFARRKTMQRSQPSSSPDRHSGIGMDNYVQSTSPLRRYLDLVVHQQLRAFLRDEPMLDGQELMERVGAADAVSGSVRQAERQSIQHWIMVYLLQNPKWQGDAIVIDQRGKRHLCLIPELAIETNINSRQSLPLNSMIRIELTRVNLPDLEASFRQIDSSEQSAVNSQQ